MSAREPNPHPRRTLTITPNRRTAHGRWALSNRKGCVYGNNMRICLASYPAPYSIGVWVAQSSAGHSVAAAEVHDTSRQAAKRDEEGMKEEGMNRGPRNSSTKSVLRLEEAEETAPLCSHSFCFTQPQV